MGGLRTALFNWLFARHNNGTFFIRVEDTDRERSKVEYMQAQLEALAWVGITSDEKPLIQSERMHIYEALIQTLLDQKKVYRCICTSEEVEQRVRAAGITGEHYAYDGLCRKNTVSADSTKPFVIRFALPYDFTELMIEDLIRGTLTFKRDQLDDFIIIRSDKTPTYNFVVVVDDAYLKISHVIRGEEHIPNTPKQLLLYQALNQKPPLFAHIPMILGTDGNKLSKRDGAVNVLDYRKDGYLPDALVNYMVRLGWAHGDQEIFTRDELIQFFSLEHVGKKGAIFDYAKLEWVNSVYLHKTPVDHLLSTIVEFVDPEWSSALQQWTGAQIKKAIEIYRDRVKTVGQLATIIKELYVGPSVYAQEDVAKWMTQSTREFFGALIAELEQNAFGHDALKEAINAFCKKHDCKLVTVAQPIRIALTGGTASPGVFDLLALLDKKESIKRLRALERFLE